MYFEDCIFKKTHTLSQNWFPYPLEKSLMLLLILEKIQKLTESISSYSCADNNESLYIPRGFAHGYLTLSKEAIINYHVDNYYNPTMESGIPFDDKFLNIDWGLKTSNFIISEKDKIIKILNGRD